VSNPYSLGLHAFIEELGNTLDGNTKYSLVSAFGSTAAGEVTSDLAGETKASGLRRRGGGGAGGDMANLSLEAIVPSAPVCRRFALQSLVVT
jgi:hypothetical protein